MNQQMEKLMLVWTQ